MKTSIQNNTQSLIIIANKLEELLNQVTFVGGSIMGFLITDSAAPDVRITTDIDCIVNVITVSNYYQFASKLRKKGLKELSTGDHPICRWDCDGIFVDIVPIDEKIFGFSNKWYADAIKNPISIQLTNTHQITIISAPYFLATKLEAFNDRGNHDYLSSHDLEDIISVLDGRTKIIEEIAASENALKTYLSSKFASLISNSRFLQALSGHLNYSSEVDFRKTLVMNKINQIIALEIC